MQTQPKKPCKYCGVGGHYPFQCFQRPRSAMSLESPKAKRKRVSTATRWLKANPPDEDGNWTCYLQISSMCPRQLSRSLLTLEHVKAKVRHPELKYDITNIRPSCSFCNRMKASRSLEELVRIWPHLVKYLDRPEKHDQL